ncbi:MAG TPA: hypothetical protein VNU46_02775 [Gemmatimonadaceae bacterium]|nr:hypothetical protein [Gemmatimonadaceae bacterium]
MLVPRNFGAVLCWGLLLGGCATSLLAGVARAQGGPPLVTDDPGTPGPGHWEINIATTYTAAGSAWTTELPLIDANYGVGQTVQLKIETPWLIDHPADARSQTGSGNMLLGVKWRFLDQGEEGFAVSTYPQVAVQPPGSPSYRRGMVEATPALLLPLEVTHRLGPVALNAEAGAETVRRGGTTLFYGLAMGHPLTTRVELVGEFHGSSTLSFGDEASLFNIGGRVTLTPHCLLLLSGGHTLHASAATPGGLLAYTALQLQL